MGLYNAINAIDNGACPYCLHLDCQCEDEENALGCEECSCLEDHTIKCSKSMEDA